MPPNDKHMLKASASPLGQRCKLDSGQCPACLSAWMADKASYD